MHPHLPRDSGQALRPFSSSTPEHGVGHRRIVRPSTSMTSSSARSTAPSNGDPPAPALATGQTEQAPRQGEPPGARCSKRSAWRLVARKLVAIARPEALVDRNLRIVADEPASARNVRLDKEDVAGSRRPNRGSGAVPVSSAMCRRSSFTEVGASPRPMLSARPPRRREPARNGGWPPRRRRCT